MRALRLLGLCGFVFQSASAYAAPLLSPPSPVPEPDTDAAAPLVPPARDTLGGHLVVGASGMVVVPWGDLAANASADDLGTGYGFGVDLGYGLARSVAVGLWGQLTLHDPGCAADADPVAICKATSYAVGPFVRYHLVQGVRFDPWILAGLGFRGLRAESNSESGHYSGIEWLRLALGGDYYPSSNFGFGPMVELDWGVFGQRPAGTGASGAHFSLLAGLRLILDVPGK